MLCPSWQWIKKNIHGPAGNNPGKSSGNEQSVKSDPQGSIEMGCDVGSGREK